MNSNETGKIVWHDLFTPDPGRSMTFYTRIANWHFVTEHASDFAWGGGRGDFILALSGDEAGAGIAETPKGLASGWIPYVEVEDVDAVVGRAAEAGGEVIKPPFDVPGVGRNCLLRDPLGAYVGITRSGHDFPMPTRQFGLDVYLMPTGDVPGSFYERLFGWRVDGPGETDDRLRFHDAQGDMVARLCRVEGLDATWAPCLKVKDPEGSVCDAEDGRGAVVAAVSGDVGTVILRDPNKALFTLSAG